MTSDRTAEHGPLVEAALAIHKPGSIGFLTGDCAGEDPDCDHDGACPTKSMSVCAGCWEFAETIHPYFTDRPVPDEVMWPCATASALGVRPTRPGTSDGA